MTLKAASSLAAMSFLKWLAVSFTHQNGREHTARRAMIMEPKFESITATDAPTAKNSFRTRHRAWESADSLCDLEDRLYPGKPLAQIGDFSGWFH